MHTEIAGTVILSESGMATSYILPGLILLVSRPQLRQGPFEYKHQLAPKYARVIRKVLPQ